MVFKFQKFSDLGWYENLLWLTYVIAFAVIIYFYNEINKQKYKYILQAYLIKITGGLIFALVYVFYYKGGDTSRYFVDASELTDIFYTKPFLYFKLLFSDSTVAPDLLNKNMLYIFYAKSHEEWFMVRLSTVFNIFGFNTYLGMTFFFSLMSFIGSYQLFLCMNKLLPNHEKALFYINFCIPSVLFWGSGVLKDTFSLFSLCFMISSLYKILNNKKIIINILIFIITGYIIFRLKAYILLSFTLWFFLTIFLFYSNKSKNLVVKFLIIPYFFILISIISFFSLKFLLDNSNEYNENNVMTTIAGFHSWHSQTGNSSYNLGEFEYTYLGILSHFPSAVNTTLYRPYLWESKNALMLLSSLESFLYLLASIYLIIKLRFSIFKIIFTNYFVTGAFVFFIFYSFIIGVTSYNFGALSRFKIQILPIFAFILLYLYSNNLKNKNLLLENKKTIIKK